MATFNLFFTGRDDPLDSILIGEDTSGPRYFCFESQGAKTTIYSNDRLPVATMLFGRGNNLGTVIFGDQSQISIPSLLSRGTTASARAFIFPDGRKYEWRRTSEPGGYDLYAMNTPIVRVAAFRRYREDTAIGRCTGLLQYTFAQDALLLYTLATLSLNRWFDNMYAAT